MVIFVKSTLLIVFLLFLLALGSYCLFFPKSVQEYAARVVNFGVLGTSSGLQSFVRSSGYVFVVRATGIIAYVIVALLAVALYREGIR
jgi:hypothetical protein